MSDCESRYIPEIQQGQQAAVKVVLGAQIFGVSVLVFSIMNIVLYVFFVGQVLSFMSACLVGIMVKASASRVEDPEFESHSRRDFSCIVSYQ